MFGRHRSNIIRVSAVVIVLGVGGVWGARWIEHRANHVFENDARIAADMVAISSRVGGWVVARPVSQGDSVSADDVLVRIDAREARFKLAELEAQISEIKAEQATVAAQIAMNEDQTRHRYEAQRHRVESSKAAFEAAQKQVRLAESDHKRVRSLAERRVVSQQRLEAADSALNDARERLTRAEADLAANESLLLEAQAARRETAVLQSRIAQLEAEERRVAAQLDQFRLDVADRSIASPIAGVVDTTFVEPGEYVRPGQRLLLIHDPDKVYVSANVRETDLKDVAVGAEVQISVDAYPGRIFRGEVTKIGDAATSQFALLPNPNPSGNFTKVTQRIPITIRIDQEERLLRPGMMVEIDIVITRRGDTRS